MPTRIILDTDIGTDVDDCLALAFILGSPEFQLEGITCVYGDVGLRARMTRKLLDLRGRNDVPVYLGTSEPLLGLQPVYWGGHEGRGLVEPTGDLDGIETESAVDYIVRTVLAHPDEIHLIAIGPLTNIALAFTRDPRVARSLGGLTIMGGALRGPQNLHLRYVEHNILCDPEAAHVVLSAEIPKTLVPLDVTLRLRLTSEHLTQIEAANTPFHAATADQLARYPRFAQQGYTVPHDALAAAVVLRPDLVTLETVHIDVELAGRLTAGMTLMRRPVAEAPANAQVALDVDEAGAVAFIMARITA